MKSLIAVIAVFMGNRSSRSNLKTLFRLLAVLFGLIVLYTIGFHLLMLREGKEHSWITGLYWTLTVMTTLGFGDITFHTDVGRLFSILVLVTGVMFMLVILPFTFIEFFYEPWMKAQAAARTPRELPEGTRQHVIMTAHDPISAALIPMLKRYGHPYFILSPTSVEALELYEHGVSVAVGDLDDPETYQRMRFGQAAMLFTNRSETLNTNITFTASESAPDVPIIALANSDAARDMLELAGASLVLRLDQIMAQALARRVIGNESRAHVIGELDGLLIAEANAAGTALVGLTLASSGIRQRTGLSVIGVWDHGHLVIVQPHAPITRQTVMLLAGTREQVDRYNEEFGHVGGEPAHVVIVGGGRVGRLTSSTLKEAGFDPVTIEKVSDRVEGMDEAVVIGDATHLEVLKEARVRDASTVIITPHDDDTNISLTIFFRRLRPQAQIIVRCSAERNVRTLHRAGADLVLSSASMGANVIFNELRGSGNLLLAEGVSIFPCPVPESMAGRLVSECAVRSISGCTIIAVEHDGERIINPDIGYRLPAGGKMLLIGTLEAEEVFLREFKPELAPDALRLQWKKDKRRGAVRP